MSPSEKSQKRINDVVLSIVVPVHNEAQTLPRLGTELQEKVTSAIDAHAELLFVDDGSDDDTWESIVTLSHVLPVVRGVRLSRNFGKEAAIRSGLECARGKAVIVMDGDLQHPPELIPLMYRRWRTGEVDIVDGIKGRSGREGMRTQFGAIAFYRLLKLVGGYDLRGASDFKLMDRRVVDALLAMPERNLFFRGMAAWLGFRSDSIVFNVPPRAAGETSWGMFRLVRLAVGAVTAFSTAPLHLVTILGVSFLAFATLLGVYTIAIFLAGEALSGFTTVIVLILITGGALMVALGIIGEYIARIYDEVKRRPTYVIAERTGFG